MESTLGAPRNTCTTHLPTTPGTSCTPFTHWCIAHLIPLLLGLLEFGGDHLRSGSSTACQICCDPTRRKQTMSTSNTERGRNPPPAVPALGPDPPRTPGERSRAPPRAVIPPSQSSETSPGDGGTWKNFFLPVRRSGEFFLFVRTTGRIIIPIIIKAVIGVLRVVKHRPAPCSAPVEWERWSDVSQSLDSLLPPSLPSLCLVPSLPPPHAPSPPCTHTLRGGVGIVFAILASQTARLLGYFLVLGGAVVIVVIAVASNGAAEPGGWWRMELANWGWTFEPGCAAPVAPLGSLGGPGWRGASASPPHPQRDKSKQHDVHKSRFKVSTWKFNFENGVQLPPAPECSPFGFFSPSEAGWLSYLFIFRNPTYNKQTFQAVMHACPDLQSIIRYNRHKLYFHD